MNKNNLQYLGEEEKIFNSRMNKTKSQNVNIRNKKIPLKRKNAISSKNIKV